MAKFYARTSRFGETRTYFVFFPTASFDMSCPTWRLESTDSGSPRYICNESGLPKESAQLISAEDRERLRAQHGQTRAEGFLVSGMTPVLRPVFDKFSHGVANRGCSIRIPRDLHECNYKSGYIEDRRPASNMDPYLVTAKIAETCIDEN